MTEWFQLISKTNINITLIQVLAPTTNAEEDEAKQLFEYLQDLLELTLPPPKKNVLFLYV